MASRRYFLATCQRRLQSSLNLHCCNSCNSSSFDHSLDSFCLACSAFFQDLLCMCCDCLLKKSHKSIRLDTSFKSSFNTSTCYSKNLLKIMCWICNWKDYYVINCKDEKIKNKSKEFNANQVFIDSMLHMSHFKISRKDNFSMNALNHQEKNKKFSL